MTRESMLEIARKKREAEALVGETVRIKTLEELHREYGEEDKYGEINIPGSLPMLPKMIEELCGEYVSITGVTTDGSFDTNTPWYICMEMIDESSLPVDIPESDELNSFLDEFF